jgi:putative thioredoxin
MAGRPVVEVTTETFRRDVIQKSRSVPVVVDFWAPWCSPCLILGPILEKVVAEFGGKIVLAKVNMDTSPELAQRYGVTSIPSVKLFIDGEVAAEFTGVLPESQVREFLREALPSEADDVLMQAEELRQKGMLKDAEALAKKALEKVPGDEHALEILAVAAMATGRVDNALDLVNRMESPSKDMEFLVGGAEFWRLAAEARSRTKTPQPGHDLDAKISDAASHASRGEFPQALDLLLDIVEENKSFRDGLARKAIVSLFVVMGLTNPVVKEYQSRLARLLF